MVESSGRRRWLRCAVLRPTKAGNNAFTFIDAATFSNHAGGLRYAQAGSTIVSGDVDGDGQADFQIALAGNLTLAAGDFVL